MALDLAVVAGGISTSVFAGSMLPMVVKALRTRDLASYSLPSLLLTNAGNVVHSVYVSSLPVGPIWALHAFYLVVTGLMLALYLRYRPPRADVGRTPHPAAAGTHGSPDVADPGPFLASEHAVATGAAAREEIDDDDDDEQDHDDGRARAGAYA